MVAWIGLGGGDGLGFSKAWQSSVGDGRVWNSVTRSFNFSFREQRKLNAVIGQYIRQSGGVPWCSRLVISQLVTN